MKFIQVIKRIKYFFYSYLLVLAFAVFILLLTVKSDLHIFINQHHSVFYDLIFKYLTYLGDGLFAAFVSILLLFVSLRVSLVFAAVNIISGLFAQFLKKYIFSGSLRPKAFFSDQVQLYFVSGIDIHSFNSFPSGHSITAFLICTYLASLSNNKYWQFSLMFAGMIISFSRVYLSQHFFEDIVAGSFIGVSFGIITLIFSRMPFDQNLYSLIMSKFKNISKKLEKYF